jgi:hypothetical protein
MRSIEPLGEQAQPIAVPEQYLDDPRSFAPEGEQMAAERILLQCLLDQHGQSIHALSLMWCTT